MSFLRASAIVLPLLSAIPALAAGVNNGSLTGSIDNNGVPPGWTRLSGSPDVMDGGNNAGAVGMQRFGAKPQASPDGGTWVALAVDGSMRESFGQKIAGLAVGTTYELSWFAGNFGYVDGSFSYTGSNRLLAFDSLTGQTLGQGSTLALASDWKSESFRFVAATDTLNLAFRLGDQNSRSYLSIDGIRLSSVSAVPESSTLMMAGLGLAALALALRRRQR